MTGGSPAASPAASPASPAASPAVSPAARCQTPLHREEVLLRLLVPVLLLRQLLAPWKVGRLDILWVFANFLFVIFFLNMWLKSFLQVFMLILIWEISVFTVIIPTCLNSMLMLSVWLFYFDK